MANHQPPLGVEVARRPISLQHVVDAPHAIHGRTIQGILVGGVDQFGKPRIERGGVGLELELGDKADWRGIDRPGKPGKADRTHAETRRQPAIRRPPPHRSAKGPGPCESRAGRCSMPARSNWSGRFLRLSGHKTRWPDDCGASRLRLDEDRPSQLVRPESPPNPITGQRLPLDRCPKHGHLLLELRFLKPFQKEAETKILLIGQKLCNARGGGIGHGVFQSPS